MSLHTDSPGGEGVLAASSSPSERAKAIFSIDGLDLSHSRSTRRKRRAGVAAIAIVIVIVVALLANRAFAAATQNYQVAVASTRDVVSTWDGVATIEPTSKASVAFPVSGTIKTVDVRQGDTVVVGQTLATLDEDAFTETLHQTEAALAQANLTLSRARDGEDVGGTGSPNGSNSAVVPTAATTGDQSTNAPSGATTASPEVSQAQQAVLQAQQQVDAALAKSSAALTSANSVCAADSPQPPSSSEDSQDGSDDAPDTTACQSALKKVQEQQRATAQAQTKLANASRSLDQLLQQQAASAANQTASPTNSEGSSQTESSVSSEDLAKYEAAVYAAAVDVIAAQQAIKQATIVSPIAGTVASVDIAVRDEVASGSTTEHIEIVGSGGYEATTTVGVDDIADIEVGQSATVIPDGVERSIRGEVVAISISPVDDNSSTSYRVTVALNDKTDGLRIGSTGSVAIVTGQADGAIAVPTSAVTVGSNRSTVQVLNGSDVQTVSVQVGVIGGSWTQILDGITKGQRVVVADVDEPLPNSATDSSNGNQGGGNFPPGGFPAGGRFPGR